MPNFEIGDDKIYTGEKIRTEIESCLSVDDTQERNIEPPLKILKTFLANKNGEVFIKKDYDALRKELNKFTGFLPKNSTNIIKNDAAMKKKKLLGISFSSHSNTFVVDHDPTYYNYLYYYNGRGNSDLKIEKINSDGSLSIIYQRDIFYADTDYRVSLMLEKGEYKISSNHSYTNAIYYYVEGELEK